MKVGSKGRCGTSCAQQRKDQRERKKRVKQYFFVLLPTDSCFLFYLLYLLCSPLYIYWKVNIFSSPFPLPDLSLQRRLVYLKLLFIERYIRDFWTNPLSITILFFLFFHYLPAFPSPQFFHYLTLPPLAHLPPCLLTLPTLFFLNDHSFYKVTLIQVCIFHLVYPGFCIVFENGKLPPSSLYCSCSYFFLFFSFLFPTLSSVHPALENLCFNLYFFSFLFFPYRTRNQNGTTTSKGVRVWMIWYVE